MLAILAIRAGLAKPSCVKIYPKYCFITMGCFWNNSSLLLRNSDGLGYVLTLEGFVNPTPG